MPSERTQRAPLRWLGRNTTELSLNGALGCCVLAALYLYLRLPLANDPHIHLAGIHQGRLLGLPLSETFTFRGPVYNAYLSVLYDLADGGKTYAHSLEFSDRVLALHLITYLVSAAVFAHGLASRPALMGVRRLTLWLVTLWTLLSTNHTPVLHAEDVAATTLLLSVGFSVGPTRVAWFAGGLFAGCLPLIKGVTALLCLPALLALSLPQERRTWAQLGLPLAFWMGGFLSSIGIQSYWLWGPEKAILDLLDTMAFSRALQGDIKGHALRFIANFPRYLHRNPAFVTALAATCAMIPGWIRARKLFEPAFVLSGWLTALAILVIQDKYYTYHFATVTPIAAYCFAVGCGRLMSPPKQRINPIPILLVGVLLASVGWHFASEPLAAPATLVPFACFAGWGQTPPRRRSRIPFAGLLVALIVGSSFALWLGNWKAIDLPKQVNRGRKVVEKTEAAFRALEERNDLVGQEVLLLSYGMPSRFLRMHSACRHYFPVPAKFCRGDLRKRIRRTQSFEENLSCILNYAGEHVIVAPRYISGSCEWRKIRKKLRREYRKVDRVRGERKGEFLYVYRKKSR